MKSFFEIKICDQRNHIWRRKKNFCNILKNLYLHHISNARWTLSYLQKQIYDPRSFSFFVILNADCFILNKRTRKIK